MSDVAKTPREELECEKKYLYEYSMFWECNDGSKCQILEYDVCDLLNKLYEENEQLKYDNFMFKGVIETFQKVAISERKKLENQVDEQQATISQLEEKNEKLIQKNCIPCELVNLQTREIDKLKEENEQLRTQLAICRQSNDDGRFQVWEVPPIPKGTRITFSTTGGSGKNE